MGPVQFVTTTRTRIRSHIAITPCSCAHTQLREKRTQPVAIVPQHGFPWHRFCSASRRPCNECKRNSTMKFGDFLFPESSCPGRDGAIIDEAQAEARLCDE